MRHRHRRILRRGDCRDQVVDFADARIVFDLRFVPFELDVRARDTFHGKKCGPHWCDAARSGHS